MNYIRKSLLTLIFSSLIFIASGQKNADSLFKPHAYLYFSGYVPEITTSIRFDSKTAHIGTVVSLENSLNFDENPKLWRADGYIRAGKRSAFALTFLSINRNRSWTLERDLKFRDTTFTTGANAKMYFNTNYWGLSYRYSIFSKPTWSAGLSFGLRILTVKTGITAESKLFGSYSSNSQLVVPAALVGFHGAAYLWKRLQFRYTWEFLRLNVEGIKIYVFDNNFALEYFILKNVGLGASYSEVSYRINEIPFSEEFSGQIEYTVSGFSLFLAARF
ncbi:MAG: hypothetical protein PSX36_06555 [bacterium]|nr:hypothetical protein [bacterium]